MAGSCHRGPESRSLGTIDAAISNENFGQLHSIDLAPWFSHHGRDLPWRRTRDPWAVAVAELMLQQTQVARVIDRWYRFLDRFPTVAACAAAAPADVIDEWSGLGYNRRALYLHRLATSVMADHDGRFPRSLQALLALPGIGHYTARAIRVFAFECEEAVLDTNVARILARTQRRPLTRSEAQELADRNLAGDPWIRNQALLDIGAALCTPRNPDCQVCPLRSACGWATAGCPPPDPAIGSAAVSSGQSAFDGSDRQGRGRLVRAVRAGPVACSELAAAMGWPHDEARARRVAATVVADGLVETGPDGYSLPGGGRSS